MIRMAVCLCVCVCVCVCVEIPVSKPRLVPTTLTEVSPSRRILV